MTRPEWMDSSLFHPQPSEPVAYTEDQPNGRPATDDDLQAVLPPEMLALWQAGAFDDEEN